MPTQSESTVIGFCNDFGSRSLDAFLLYLTDGASCRRGAADAPTQLSLPAWGQLLVPTDRMLERIELMSISTSEDGTITYQRRETWARDDRSILLTVTGTFRVTDGKISQWHDVYDEEVWDSLG